ncbi:hypothetical protein R5R35_010833 [Gryllus longicercus]|uniref:Odorant binding protein n=1 Tax=Gryllus longicercus TaxID=2509291 RepID=A0AAN9VZ81_9ORTH
MRACVLLLFVVAAVTADTPEAFRKALLPYTLLCKEILKSSDADVDDVVNLRVENITEEQECLGECVMERLGMWRDGKYVAASFGLRVKLMKLLHAANPAILADVERLVHHCSHYSETHARGRKCHVFGYGVSCILGKVQ